MTATKLQKMFIQEKFVKNRQKKMKNFGVFQGKLYFCQQNRDLDNKKSN